MSRWYNRPSKFHPDALRDDINRTGLATCREVLAELNDRRDGLDDPNLTEREKTMIKCRQIARRDKAERERRRREDAQSPQDPTQVSAVLRQVRAA